MGGLVIPSGCVWLCGSGLRAWRGSSGFDSGPAPSGEQGRWGCARIRSGWGAAMPSTWNEGRRKLCLCLIAVGGGSERLLGGRLRVRSTCGRSSELGVVRGWGMAEGSGKGCGREASSDDETSLGTAIAEQGPASAPSSGVAGTDDGTG